MIQKTDEPLEFTLNKKAQTIADKYRYRKSDYIFPMLDKAVTTHEVEIKRKISSKNAYHNRILKNLFKKANITKANLSFHSARHTYAVLSIEKGADLYVLSKVLGHNSISTTEIYAKMVDKRKDELTELWN